MITSLRGGCEIETRSAVLALYRMFTDSPIWQVMVWIIHLFRTQAVKSTVSLGPVVDCSAVVTGQV